MKTLLLNTIHYLGWNTSTDLSNNIVELQKAVDNKVATLKHRCPQLEEHKGFLHDRVFKAFEGSARKRESKQFSSNANKGQIIYSSIAGLGYCYVVSVSAKKEYSLARPGFAWNSHENEFINHFGDVVHRPILLPQVTVVDL